MTERILRNALDDEEELDPVLLAFLDLLDRESDSNPGRMVPVTAELMARMRTLSDGVAVDVDPQNEGAVCQGQLDSQRCAPYLPPRNRPAETRCARRARGSR